MAGYSSHGTAQKLGVKPGTTLVIVDAPAGWTIPDLPPEVEVLRRAAGDDHPIRRPSTVVAFFRSAAVLHAGIEDLARLVWPATALWVAWPRKAGGHVSDLGDTLVRNAALGLGLVDNKVAAVDEDWSALRFVWRKERRDRPPPGERDVPR